jgi:hypothetical protein
MEALVFGIIALIALKKKQERIVPFRAAASMGRVPRG